MTPKARILFFVLILTQAAHSTEEYLFELYNVMPPARFVSGLVSDDLSFGFAIINCVLILFGLWCFFARIRVGRKCAFGIAWFWVILEMTNGLAHSALAVNAGGYFPGVVTGVVLFVVAAALAVQLISGRA